MSLIQQEDCLRCPHRSSFPFRIASAARKRRAVSRAGLARAATSVPVLSVDEERWDGDQMFFRVRALGQAASGHIDVADDHVRLEVMLPWLLQRFAADGADRDPRSRHAAADQAQLTQTRSHRSNEIL